MHAGSGNMLRREESMEETTEETTNASASGAVYQIMSNSITSLTNVSRSGGQ